MRQSRPAMKPNTTVMTRLVHRCSRRRLRQPEPKKLYDIFLETIRNSASSIHFTSSLISWQADARLAKKLSPLLKPKSNKFVDADYFERSVELQQVYTALIKDKYYKKNLDLVRVAIAQHMVIDKEVSKEFIDAWIKQHVRNNVRLPACGCFHEIVALIVRHSFCLPIPVGLLWAYCSRKAQVYQGHLCCSRVDRDVERRCSRTVPSTDH
jgi:hypothetical protein